MLVAIDNSVEVRGIEDGDVLGKGGGNEHEKCDSKLRGRVRGGSPKRMDCQQRMRTAPVHKGAVAAGYPRGACLHGRRRKKEAFSTCHVSATMQQVGRASLHLDARVLFRHRR